MDLDRMREYHGRRIDRLFGETPGRPVVVVFREKHADDRSACLDRAELEQVCLKKLWERYHMGHYCDFGDPDPDSEPMRPPIPKADVYAMQDGETRSGATEDWRQYDAAVSNRRESAELLETVKAALSGRDGTIAFAMLQACNCGEYEGFEIESARSADGPPAGDLLGVKPD